MPPPSQPWCDFDKLSTMLIAQFEQRFPVSSPFFDSPHGPAHWRRVEKNGLWLSTRSGADPLVVRLFAWIHDSCRENDGFDPEHGPRAAYYAETLRGEYFELADAAFEDLTYACTWHTDQASTDNTTIGTCWDADRLDLGRVGVIPSEEYMSTTFGKEVARAGSFFPFRDALKAAGARDLP